MKKKTTPHTKKKIDYSLHAYKTNTYILCNRVGGDLKKINYIRYMIFINIA